MVSRSKTRTPLVWVFVEGGGTHRAQQTWLRQGFAKLFEKVLGARPKPTVIACGSREEAFKEWQQEVLSSPDKVCLLLVDSEAPVKPGDGWVKPEGATDDQLHFMVQAMEAWFFADPEALERYYGSNAFQPSALPARKDVENISKQDLERTLKHATRDTKKGTYDKSHGFALIGLVDPAKIRAASPQAARFFDELLAACPSR
jgi:hypothetical protein